MMAHSNKSRYERFMRRLDPVWVRSRGQQVGALAILAHRSVFGISDKPLDHQWIIREDDAPYSSTA
jgi:hypothetical protein